MKSLLIFIISFGLIACSSARQIQKEGPVFKQVMLQNIEISGSISTDFPELKQTFDFKIQLSGHDSVAMIIYGPFSMAIGKLYSTNQHFIFYNALTNEVFEGTPSQKNLRLAMNLPLSFTDLISVLRCESAVDAETFIPDESYNKDDRILFKSLQPEFVDFALFDSKNNMITQYQRKLKDGKILMTVANSNFDKYNNINLPNNVMIKFPIVDGYLTMAYKNISVNPEFEKPFNFNVPGSAKVHIFD
jgi:hypothetical protein